jgi:hypothetical protein
VLLCGRVGDWLNELPEVEVPSEVEVPDDDWSADAFVLSVTSDQASTPVPTTAAAPIDAVTARNR